MIERCLCGAPVRDIMAAANTDLAPEDQRHVWTHVHGADTRCTEVRRIDDLIPDRKLTQGAAEQLAGLNDRTRRAAGEVERFQSMIAELHDSVTELRAELSARELIRRATLTEVWEALVTAGDLQGARVVRDMLKGTSS